MRKNIRKVPPPSEKRDPAQYTPAASRRGRGIEVWAALRSPGSAGLTNLTKRTCRHAQRFAEGLQAADYQILNEVVINQVLVSFGDEAKTRRVVEAIQRDGTCLVRANRLAGTFRHAH